MSVNERMRLGERKEGSDKKGRKERNEGLYVLNSVTILWTPITQFNVENM